MTITATAPAITGVHPYADKFPMLPDSELQELAESILQNGLRQPIVLTKDGLILDGRNRAKACEMAGVTPDTVVYEGDDLAEFVIDSNSSRRHMSTGARAMATALVLLDAGQRSNGKWDGARSRSIIRGSSSTNSESSWVKAMTQCGFVLDHSPELADLVVTGEVALDSAYRQAEHARDAERRKLEEQERLKAEEADAQSFIEENAPDLADRVDGKDLHSYVEARDIWSRRNREEAARIRKEKADKERAEQAERQMHEDQVHNIGDILVRAHRFTIPEKREFFHASMNYAGRHLSAEQAALHTPTQIKTIAAGLVSYANELESQDV